MIVIKKVHLIISYKIYNTFKIIRRRKPIFPLLVTYLHKFVRTSLESKYISAKITEIAKTKKTKKKHAIKTF